MSEFHIGRICVVDSNNNDVYDRNLDTITDCSGNNLRPNDAKIREALRMMGVGSFSGVRLSDAQTYFTLKASVEEKAVQEQHLGEIEPLLDQARAAAGRAHIRFDERWARRIRQSALRFARQCVLRNEILRVERDRIERNLSLAEDQIREGHRDLAEMFLSYAINAINAVQVGHLPPTPEIAGYQERISRLQQTLGVQPPQKTP